MPWTLYRYILKDVLKLLLLSTSVLVSVMGFAAAIKPLSEGLLDFNGLLRFLGAITPTMLVFALPFSTAFAVTLVYCRMATDNEVLACSAGGLSYRTMIGPVAMLGAALMVLLFVLSNWVLPPLSRAALTMVQKDVLRVLVNQLGKGESVVVGDYVVYANSAAEAPPPTLENSALQPEQMILLRGVALGRLDPASGRIVADHSAQEADILVFRDGPRTWIQFRLKNPLYHDNSSGEATMGARVAEKLPNMELPNLWIDKARAMTWGQLVELTRNPERFPAVAVNKQNLASLMSAQDVLRRIEARLSDTAQRYGQTREQGGAIVGLAMRGARDAESFVVSAAAIRREKDALILAGAADKPVRIDYADESGLVRRYEARGNVELTITDAVEGAEPRIVLDMKDVYIFDPKRAARGTERSALKLTRLYWPQPLAGDYQGYSSSQLIAMSESEMETAPAVAAAGKLLKTHITGLLGKVVAEFHMRAAGAFGCLLAAVLGAVLSIRLRGAMPLVVFFWSFLIVLGSIIFLNAGGRITADPSRVQAVGLAVLWAGNLAMAAVIGTAYARVSKH